MHLTVYVIFGVTNLLAAEQDSVTSLPVSLPQSPHTTAASGRKLAFLSKSAA